MTDLVFDRSPLANPAALVFGDEANPGPRFVNVDLAFPLVVRAKVGPRIKVSVNVAFSLSVSAEVGTDFSADRPLVAEVVTRHQDAVKAVTGAADGMQATNPLPSGVESRHEAAVALPAGFAAAFEQGIPTPSDRTAIRHQGADGVLTWLIEQVYQDGNRNSRNQSRARHQDALRLQAARIWTDWQERFRDRRPSLRHPWQDGVPLAKRHTDSAQSGVPHPVGWTALHQEAIVPPPGVTLPPEPPEPPPCYEPDPDLVFQQALALNGNLLFLCQYGDEGPAASVVVPVRRVYVVINNIALRRVDGDVALPCFSMSLSIDADSWTWGFNASLPYSVIASVLPDVNGPIELEANINGTLYRVLAESIARDRSFASDRIRVSGRGKTALLASPYSAIQTFANSTQRTAQQLMADVLTLNGVPLAWTIDWQITDWLVPSGAFNVNGAYIDGLLAVAGAAGAYLQPHPVNQQISVLHRYPSPPWDLGSVTPDFEIPSAVVTREGLEWIEKPAYNRVYVSGTSQGVLARVTRAGTAGDVAAPMIVDSLITAAAAGRQRGIAVLGDTGRQVNVTLRMPVLPATGVITPGKFVRYDDDGTLRLGIVRSTSVDASFPNVWQTLRLETHL